MSTLDQFGVDLPKNEPWKDEETLRSLYEDDDLNQTEIAEHLTAKGHDVTAPTISYWFKKHKISTNKTDYGESETPDGAECVKCSSETPGPNNLMCDKCLSEAREKDKE